MILALLIFSSPSFALRLLVTDDFEILDYGSNQWELAHISTTPKSGNSTRVVSDFIKRGVLPGIELGIEAPVYYDLPSANNGVGDAYVHAKFQILGSNAGGVSGRLDMKLANGSVNAGLGTGYQDYGLVLIGTKKEGNLLSHINIGYISVGVAAGAASANVFNLLLASEKTVNSFLSLYGETSWSNNSAVDLFSLSFGGKFYYLSNVLFNAIGTVGLNNNTENSAIIGMTLGF